MALAHAQYDSVAGGEKDKVVGTGQYLGFPAHFNHREPEERRFILYFQF
jgi:hypothetical protein